MTVSSRIAQTPSPGERIVAFRGDTRTFTLKVPDHEQGRAWLRTNLGRAPVIRKEIIRQVTRGEHPMSRDWFDLSMPADGQGRFTITLPLAETGYFEGKCFFMPEGKDEPVWPEGGNVEISVEPAHTCCGNAVYNAFVRQFGPNRDGRFQVPDREPWIEALDTAGFAVIPPSGTFRDLIGALDFIVGGLGCRTLQLLPIHPIPTTYARMGRFGSPYAALSFTEVDPALAEFDPRATPMEQFIELVDAVHRRDARIFIDIAINHTGWAASLHETHPQWLARTEGGEIQMPGAWGVTWEDLTRLDYAHKDLWQYMAQIFIKWCRRGVDGFRCDAGYMIPVPAWRYIIASVREQFPETVFVLEGLGGKISVTRELLGKANFNWTYSELFQNFDRGQIESYLPVAIDIARHEGTPIHFCETHDNNRLAATSRTFARMRTALCALLSHQGSFGFANGVEWFATEKIDVHGSPSLNWGGEPNQVADIRRLTALLDRHPCFHDGAELTLIQRDAGNTLVCLRHHPGTGRRLVVAANLDDQAETVGAWDHGAAGMGADALIDLLTGRSLTVRRDGPFCRLRLEPGQVMCLSADREDLNRIAAVETAGSGIPERVRRQMLRGLALTVHAHFFGTGHLGGFDPDRAGAELAKDPEGFVTHLNPEGDEPRVVHWRWPEDVRRQVVVPPGFFVLVRCPVPFRVRLADDRRILCQQEGLAGSDGGYFALVPPHPADGRHRSLRLELSVFEDPGCRHAQAPLLQLAPWDQVSAKTAYSSAQIDQRPMLLMLDTNGRGGMLRANVRWGELTSRYDALLAANLDPKVPEDRRVLLTRCRAWLVFQGYSQELNVHCTQAFFVDDRSRGYWDFRVPAGQGEHVHLTIGMEMTDGENAVRLVFFRHPAGQGEGRLADRKPIRLILRPDVEDRSFHDTTKAYLGSENRFPHCTEARTDGFVFSPDPQRRLRVRLTPGTFDAAPEWRYMVHRPLEAQRGLDPDSDLFSPGYFSADLSGGRHAEFTAVAWGAGRQPDVPATDLVHRIKTRGFEKAAPSTLAQSLSQALNGFVVRRNGGKTVVAGYPWFLDWGRDSLIVVRALIAAGRLDEARSVLRQFGRFEKDGTIPNMIRGNDAGNRDTSDAPLWFIVACGELARAEGGESFLDESHQGRSIRDALLSIGQAYVRGTPNGIRVDPDSGLVFSPAHFTWMDTDHPAGTPRAGYPVEIQALWFAALGTLRRLGKGTAAGRWDALAEKVRQALETLFWLEGCGYLADCIRAPAGTPAAAGVPDDALRPNQLMVLTLGAVVDPLRFRRILSACQALILPGAIRSLADRPVQQPLEIRREGRLLGDPHRPYRGTYAGDEDTSRKPAYHNGTGWAWPFPMFCEAWAMAYGDQGRVSALNWLASVRSLLDSGCIGHVPEIVDGDAPHTQRGCDAQAWSASEFLRVHLKLTTGR